MRLISNFGRTMCAMLLLFVVGCVDENYRIDQIDTEVTIATGTTTLPLGALEKMTLGELMEDTEIKGLEKDENGNYCYNFNDKGEPISINGVTTSFKIPDAGNSFSITFPEFNLTGKEVVIDADEDVTINVESLEQFMPDGYTEFTLPADLGIAYPKFSGSYSKNFGADDSHHLHFEVPEEINEIHKIYFKNIETGHNGAPMRITVDLNDMAGINGGGTVWLDLGIGGGEFTLLNENNEVICSSDKYSAEYELESGSSHVEFVVYIESITNTSALDENHEFDMPLELTCDVKFEVQTKAGTFSLQKIPHIALDAQFEFGDAEVVLNNNSDIIDYDGTEPFNIAIEGLPEQVKQINEIDIEPAELEFYAEGLDWLADAAAVEVVITLPDYLKLHGLEDVDYTYDDGMHQLNTTIEAIQQGLRIGLDGLNFGAAGIEPDESGAVNLTFAPKVKAHFNTTDDVKISTLIPDDNTIDVKMGIRECNIELQSVKGVVDYTFDYEKEFKITTSDDMGDIKIEGVGLKPVLEVNVENPLTVSANMMLSLTTNDGRELTIGSKNDPIEIGSATVAGGNITPAKTLLVLATEDVSAQYKDATCIVCDLDELLAGTLPETLKIVLSFWTNVDDVIELYVADEFVINYDYSLKLPIELNSDTSIVYEQEFMFVEEDGENPLSMLADLPSIKVGDVAVIADITTTLPLELVASAELLDADGKKMNGLLVLPEEGNSIVGSADGKTPAESSLRLELCLDDYDGDIKRLVDVAGISFKLEAKGAGEDGAPLLDEQYVEAVLKLELSGGITADLKELGNM